MKKTRLLGLFLAPMALLSLSSCGGSSSSDEGEKSAEAPKTLKGITLTGEMYVDYLTNEGYEREAKDFVFRTEKDVSFDFIEDDDKEPEGSKAATGTYDYHTTGYSTASITIESELVTFLLDHVEFYRDGSVTAQGYMIEANAPQQQMLPAKGKFTMTKDQQ